MNLDGGEERTITLAYGNSNQHSNSSGQSTFTYYTEFTNGIPSEFTAIEKDGFVEHRDGEVYFYNSESDYSAPGALRSGIVLDIVSITGEMDMLLKQ